MATIEDNQSLECTTLSGDADQRANVQTFVQDTEKNNGLIIHYSGGDYCDEIRDYDLTITIICN